MKIIFLDELLPARTWLILTLKRSGSNTRDSVEKFLAANGHIACHFPHFARTEDMRLKSAVFGQKSFGNDYRKEFLGEGGLWITPTKRGDKPMPRADDLL